MTVDVEDHTTTDSTLISLRVAPGFPVGGGCPAAYLHRTEADCRDLAYAGSRIRLCKGAYREPESVAYQDGAEVDKAYIRCLKILMAGEGYPMVASHDHASSKLPPPWPVGAGREPKTFEYQMLYGIRPDEQQRIADRGDQMRVYIPFGEEWYGYLMRRMAERPPTLPSSFAAWPPRADRGCTRAGLTKEAMDGHHGDLRGWRDGGDPVPGCCARVDRPVTSSSQRSGPTMRTPCVRAMACACSAGRAAGRRPRPRRQAPGHGRPARRNPRLHRSRQLVVSLAAGIPTAYLESRLPEGSSVVRVMPNAPALVDQGMAAVSPGRNCT